MNYMVIVLAVLSALTLTCAAASVFVLRRMQGLARQVNEVPEVVRAAPSETERELRQAVEALAAEITDLRNAASGDPADPAGPRPGLNMSKRSQALRLHRRGESAEQIAAALQVPRQEVELLLKVHRVVLSQV